MIGSITSLNSAHKKEKRLKQKRRVLKRLLKFKSSDGDNNNKKSSLNVTNETTNTNTNTNKMIVIQNSTQFSISFFSPTLYNFIIVYLIKYFLLLRLIYLIVSLFLLLVVVKKNQTLNCSIKSDDESIYNKLLFFSSIVFDYTIMLIETKKNRLYQRFIFFEFCKIEQNCKYKDILGN